MTPASRASRRWTTTLTATATTVENDKTPKGILGQHLNLDILPPPQSDTTTLESGDTDEYDGPEGPQHEETQG